MYKAYEIEKKYNLWYFFCVKLYDTYRYYGFVYDTASDNCYVSLMDPENNILGHFLRPKKDYNPDEVFLNLCIEYDKYWYPEIFESDPDLLTRTQYQL